MTATATKRDATRIKELAQKILSGAESVDGSILMDEDKAALKEIVQIAIAVDARTGRKDPTLRKPRKKQAKKRAGSGK